MEEIFDPHTSFHHIQHPTPLAAEDSGLCRPSADSAPKAGFPLWLFPANANAYRWVVLSK